MHENIQEENEYKLKLYSVQHRLKQSQLINKTLRYNLKELEKEYETIKEKINKSKQISFENIKLRESNASLFNMLEAVTKENKRLYGREKRFDDIKKTMDGWRISIHTIYTTFEYVFIYQKLFEMFIFDFIVDRQNPDNKTEKDTEELVKICKSWTNEILTNQIPRQKLNMREFRQAFNTFTNEYVEHMEG